MRIQDYQQPPKLTLGVVAVIAAIIPILLGYFLVSGTATSSCYEGLCGTTSTTATSSAGPTTSVAVSIPSGAGTGPTAAPGYAPASIKVVIGNNNTVVWTNNDSAHHTVTSVNGNGTLSSGDMAPAATYSFTFTSPGTYKYMCDYHSWMAGTVVVVNGTGVSPNVAVSIPAGAGTGPTAAPGFGPADVTVVIGVNATVTWTNNDSAHHTVTASDGSFNSGDMAPGATFTYTFTTAGTYKYVCSYHSWMAGTVTVVQKS